MRGLRLLILGAITIGLGVLVFYVIPSALQAEARHATSAPKQCIPNQTPTSMQTQADEEFKNAPPQAPDPPILGKRFAGAAICLLALYLGRFASGLSKHPVLFGLVVGGDTQYKNGQTAVQVGLVALLIFASAALGYETWAVAQGNWAVTDYVHCAYDVNSWLTIAFASALSFVLGNWLWHKTPSDQM